MTLSAASRRTLEGGTTSVVVIDISLLGSIDVADVVELHRRVDEALDAAPASFVIVDVSKLVDFSPSVRTPGVPFLESIKARGMPFIVAVGASGLVRMMGAAIALAANLPIRFVADGHEADHLVMSTVKKRAAS